MASSQSRLSPRRRLLFSAFLLAAIAGLQEIAFRWMFPLPELPTFNRIDYSPLIWFERTDGAGQHGLSNVKFRWESEPDGFAFDHTLNLYGFRGPDFRTELPRDRPRVVFVGDSFVEGCGVSDDDTIPMQFARIVGDHQPVEAINLGVKGTGFAEYWRIVRDGVYLLHPRTVFLVVCWNDLPTPFFSGPDPESIPEFPRLNPFVPRIVQLLTRLGRGLVVPRRYVSGPLPYVQPVPALSNPITQLIRPPENVDPAILQAMGEGKLNPWLLGMNDRCEKMSSFDPAKTGGATRYFQIMASHCRRQRTELVLVYVPLHVMTNSAYITAQNRLGGHQFSPDTMQFARALYRRQPAHLVEVSRDLDIPFFDTTGDFARAEQSEGRMFWPVDGHCNAAGYHLIAQICARYWLSRVGATHPQ